MKRHRTKRRSWFLPEVPDVLGLLVHQGELTVGGMEALERWAVGEQQASDDVRAAEHDADDAKWAALEALRRAFVTPMEPEDLFELSERLDRVMNQAKDLVREAEVLNMAPDRPMAEMSGLALTGARALARALGLLASDPDGAIGSANEAIRQQRAIEHVYRRAMSRLLRSDDAHEIGGRRELYRRCARLGDAIEHVADRVWCAVVKRS